MKYISCSTLLSGGSPVLSCVTHNSGDEEGKPYLYNSIEEAKGDQYFDPDNDFVLSEDEYYKRLEHNQNP